IPGRPRQAPRSPHMGGAPGRSDFGRHFLVGAVMRSDALGACGPCHARCVLGYNRAAQPRRNVMTPRTLRDAVIVAVSALAALVAARSARAEGRPTDAYIEETRARWERLARQIWDTPELGLRETKSAAALAEVLQKEGFQVKWGIGGEATAFVATAGSGAPAVGLLAEDDALPGPSQAAGGAKERERAEGAPGPARGRHLPRPASRAGATGPHPR